MRSLDVVRAARASADSTRRALRIPSSKPFCQRPVDRVLSCRVASAPTPKAAVAACSQSVTRGHSFFHRILDGGRPAGAHGEQARSPEAVGSFSGGGFVGAEEGAGAGAGGELSSLVCAESGAAI